MLRGLTRIPTNPIARSGGFRTPAVGGRVAADAGVLSSRLVTSFWGIWFVVSDQVIRHSLAGIEPAVVTWRYRRLY